ncbi:MAG: glycosyltransferase family 2 protein [Deltaproteobacteria bacterium]|nr:glycosyltransferase family 2 protein [Deltaproteobacteria bacterium]
MNTPEFSVVMPVFNESRLVERTVGNLLEVLKDERSFEIILVDDGSSDDTWEAIFELSEKYQQVKGVKFTRNFGHQAALQAGIAHSSGQSVITMDSDGEHPVEFVKIFVEKWREGARVVQGIRAESKKLPLIKRVTSKGFYSLFSWLAQTEIRPGSADFRLLDRSVVNIIHQHPEASGFLRGFIPWSGFNTVYVPFEQGTRLEGVSKFTPKKMIGMAREGIIGFSVKPLRLSMLLGLLTCLFALVNLVYSIVVRLVMPETVVPGWATVTSLLALLGGVQLLVMGILGEYIAVLFKTVRNEPGFIVGEKSGFSDDV